MPPEELPKLLNRRPEWRMANSEEAFVLAIRYCVFAVRLHHPLDTESAPAVTLSFGRRRNRNLHSVIP